MDKNVIQRNARWAFYIWVLVTAVMMVHVSLTATFYLAEPTAGVSVWSIALGALALHALPEAVALTAWLVLRRKAKRLE
ncbi:MAG: hypothetical protein PHO66_01090 [Eubacteriales bacterium]|nr:hypothetical protein [Eubacteriales bacterium]